MILTARHTPLRAAPSGRAAMHGGPTSLTTEARRAAPPPDLSDILWGSGGGSTHVVERAVSGPRRASAE